MLKHFPVAQNEAKRRNCLKTAIVSFTIAGINATIMLLISSDIAPLPVLSR